MSKAIGGHQWLLLSTQFEFGMKHAGQKCGTWAKIFPRDCIFNDGTFENNMAVQNFYMRLNVSTFLLIHCYQQCM